MKLSKKKVVALALAVCLIAILSMSSLAWFTDDDSVTNNFYVAGSEDQNPDAVFSVDVWEDDDKEDTGDEEKIQDGIEYDAILPGDDLYKEVNVQNTGAYEQYVRAIVTVSDAHIWQQLNNEVYVPLNKIATDLSADFQPWSIEYNADEDTLTYVLYYDKKLPAEGEDTATLFTNIHIPEAMDRYQAAEMAGGFVINVVAEAVQTEHVGANAAAAFETVGMAIPTGNTTIVTTPVGVLNTLSVGGDVVLENNVDMNGAVWTPVGTQEAPYTGTFDGNGYTISNFTVGNEDAANAAMFAYVGNGATIKNVKFEKVNVTGKHAATVAYMANGATIEGVEVLSGTVTSSKNYAAGIVVRGEGTTIKNCKNYAAIDGAYLGGGIAAWMPNATIEGCENYGSVTGAERAAGICALVSGTVADCVNNGDVTANGAMPAAGIIAVVNGQTTITGCTNNGAVTATYNNKWNASAAGILGHTPSAKVTITNCANTGNITSAYSVAAGIGVSQYGGITASGCTNSGVISGATGADEIVAAKGMFGGSNTVN